MVQPKKLSATTTVNYEQLQSLPSARDPWVILQLTPGLFIDRENIGGNESGQQSSFVNKGSTTQEWTLDGVKITDMSSGGSPGYYDFDAFEEMNVSTGSLDVATRSPGTVVNIVTRRGGNKTSLAGRFYLTDGQFQGKLSAEKIKEIGVVGYNRIREVRDFGFNIGGPILKDKIWWWGSYAVSDVKTVVATGTNDDSYLQNMDIKANFQLIPENRAEVYVQAGGKVKYGRSSSLSFPSGWNQYGKFHFGSPIIKVPGRAHVRRQPVRLRAVRLHRRRIRHVAGERREDDQEHLVRHRKSPEHRRPRRRHRRPDLVVLGPSPRQRRRPDPVFRRRLPGHGHSP